MRKLQDLSGVARSTISQIERDEVSPTVSTLETLAPYYGITVAEIVARKTKSELLADFQRDHDLNATELSGLLAAAKGRELIQLLTQLAQIANEHGIEQLKSVLTAYELMRQAVEAQQKS